ncbi:aminopeptidase N [Castellaniella sp.]|uniref:aminopeptidase N n=1 Tax=Castellaniella sp. TaxID=1955812 RepID=UPI003565FA37
MHTDHAHTSYRSDYVPFPFDLSDVRLEFDLAADTTRVTAVLHFCPRKLEKACNRVVLQGQDLELLELQVDGQRLAHTDYQLDNDTLQFAVPDPAREFVVRIVSQCHPAQNTSLMGLYQSDDKLFTQCEAEGFRRITWFPDRPDVMSRYEVILRADPDQYPVLLSNGNLVDETRLDDGRRQVTWQDPHPKPSYLFALVAGDFDCLERTENTRSGRPILLQVYSDRGFRAQTHWAMDCLARALHWDETRFGLELDLDRFMVVAARDFNMGAMENKGLNIFNAAYVLADPDTATDAAYRGIESVIGHEYFHNWTGNRVTCRDWFQLSLKEGLTVFREQEFAADMLARGLPATEAASARAVKRIDDVHTLRLAQFPEDAGPMAHPIRPDSYQQIANFYTATIYEKGAEVIRMQHTLLGEDGFRAGMDEYFRRHDGQAVTCDDFVSAMESVYMARHPGRDFAVFRRWYEQAGTPRIRVDLQYDRQARQAVLTLEQRCDPVGLETRRTPVAAKPPLHVPVAIGLLGSTGAALPIHHAGQVHDTLILELCETRQSWVFTDLDEPPRLSLLRNFSAPVILETRRTAEDLALLAQYDADAFARWDACQELMQNHLQARLARIGHQLGQASQDGVDQDKASQGKANQDRVDEDQVSQDKISQDEARLLDVWRAGLHDPSISPDYKARLLAMPAQRSVLMRSSPMDPHATVRAWNQTRALLGTHFADTWRQIHAELADDGSRPYSPDPVSAGRRALRNLALESLLCAQADGAVELAQRQYHQAHNMTERFGALAGLVHHAPEHAQDALADFHRRWQHDPLVLDRWFAVQATAPGTRVCDLHALMARPEFSLRNPNRARAVVFRFCLENLSGLHTPEGYDFWVQQVLALDAMNPEIAARLARAFDLWAQFEPGARQGMQAALERVLAAPGRSSNVHEIVSRALSV